MRLRERGSLPDRPRGFLTNGCNIVTKQPAGRWPNDKTSSEVLHEAVDSVSRVVNGAVHARNKFTEGTVLDKHGLNAVSCPELQLFHCNCFWNEINCFTYSPDILHSSFRHLY